MKGLESFEQQYQNKINCLLEKNNNKDILKAYLYYLSSNGVEGISSRYNYLRIVAAFLTDTKKNISDITYDDYTFYRAKLNNKKSSYQIVVYTALKKFSNYMFESGKSEHNYMENAKRPKGKEDQETKEKRNNNYLNKKEINNLMNYLEKGIGSDRAKSFQHNWYERDKAIITLFLNTGLRCSGLYKLDIENVDFEKKQLTTIEKGGKPRIIYLSDNMLDCLNNWINKREEILDEDTEETALFISNRKQRMKQESIAAVVSKYASQIKGKHITPHKLRATYATQIYNKEKDIKLVQELMGHANASTTMLYIRNNENRTQIGSNIMSEIVFN